MSGQVVAFPPQPTAAHRDWLDILRVSSDVPDQERPAALELTVRGIHQAIEEEDDSKLRRCALGAYALSAILLIETGGLPGEMAHG